MDYDNNYLSKIKSNFMKSYKFAFLSAYFILLGCILESYCL